MNNLPLGIVNLLLGVSLYFFGLNPAMLKLLSFNGKIPVGVLRLIFCTLGALSFVNALYILTGW
jgi:hypothetical protein